MLSAMRDEDPRTGSDSGGGDDSGGLVIALGWRVYGVGIDERPVLFDDFLDWDCRDGVLVGEGEAWDSVVWR